MDAATAFPAAWDVSWARSRCDSSCAQLVRPSAGLLFLLSIHSQLLSLPSASILTFPGFQEIQEPTKPITGSSKSSVIKKNNQQLLPSSTWWLSTNEGTTLGTFSGIPEPSSPPRDHLRRAGLLLNYWKISFKSQEVPGKWHQAAAAPQWQSNKDFKFSNSHLLCARMVQFCPSFQVFTPEFKKKNTKKSSFASEMFWKYEAEVQSLDLF